MFAPICSDVTIKQDEFPWIILWRPRTTGETVPQGVSGLRGNVASWGGCASARRTLSYRGIPAFRPGCYLKDSL